MKCASETHEGASPDDRLFLEDRYERFRLSPLTLLPKALSELNALFCSLPFRIIVRAHAVHSQNQNGDDGWKIFRMSTSLHQVVFGYNFVVKLALIPY